MYLKKVKVFQKTWDYTKNSVIHRKKKREFTVTFFVLLVINEGLHLHVCKCYDSKTAFPSSTSKKRHVVHVAIECAL